MRTHQLYDRKHHTLLPASRDSLWYGDGTKLNLYYRDESGNKRTINVYEVVDAYSEVLLGYHISEREDYIAQYHAFRMAIQRSGHKPYELVCDNQGGHKKNTAKGVLLEDQPDPPADRPLQWRVENDTRTSSAVSSNRCSGRASATRGRT